MTRYIGYIFAHFGVSDDVCTFISSFISSWKYVYIIYTCRTDLINTDFTVYRIVMFWEVKFWSESQPYENRIVFQINSYIACTCIWQLANGIVQKVWSFKRVVVKRHLSEHKEQSNSLERFIFVFIASCSMKLATKINLLIPRIKFQLYIWCWYASESLTGHNCVCN